MGFSRIHTSSSWYWTHDPVCHVVSATPPRHVPCCIAMRYPGVSRGGCGADRTFERRELVVLEVEFLEVRLRLEVVQRRQEVVVQEQHLQVRVLACNMQQTTCDSRCNSAT